MNDTQYRLITDLYIQMAPGVFDEGELLEDELNWEAEKRGYNDWIEANEDLRQ